MPTINPTAEDILEDLDFSCECFQEARVSRRQGRMVRAGEKTFLVFVGRKCIGKAHTADLAKARATEVGGTWEEVAA